MNRSPDILFITEYIKNVLYFATVRPGKVLKSSSDTHYFSIDNELVYENYYSDFGPLNLGCVYKYCVLLNDKVKQHINKQTIVHYSSIDPKKKSNAAFLLGCYGVLYLSLTPKDALKPLLVHGQSYRPFQDATQGDSNYTITLLDCLQAIKKARELGLFNFSDFNYEEYDRLDKIHGGDLNWIVPGKFLAFIGPEDYSVSLYHPPDMYVDYFLENNVKIVIRLNKRMYDGNVFNNVGIVHYDLFFPDGSCPPRHILMKFLQISEEADCAIAVHCKAGLGRTGSLIGCYLIKHYCMTAHEAIGWMRICRPGSVIGHQQAWLEQHEAWLIKLGLFYRKRMYNDINRLPVHHFGVYSIAEKARGQRPVTLQKSPSPPPPSQRVIRTEVTRPQSSKFREQPSKAKDAANKTEREQYDFRVRSPKMSFHKNVKGDHDSNISSRRASGAGEPRQARSISRSSATNNKPNKKNDIQIIDSKLRNMSSYQPPITTFRSSNGPIIKSVNDAKNFLLKSSMFNEEREKFLRNSITITPRDSIRMPNYYNSVMANTNNYVSPSTYCRNNSPTYCGAAPIPRASNQSTQHRRRLGRSPSPPIRIPKEQTRGTNTLPSAVTSHPDHRYPVRDTSTLREALSRLKLMSPRDGSIGGASVGAASLGARRDAPSPKQAPSVRSDERPIATQGDMLNSIKFQRRLRDTLIHSDKICKMYNDKNSLTLEKTGVKKVDISPRMNNTGSRFVKRDYATLPRDKTPVSRSFYSSNRPASPKGARSPHTPSFY